MFKRVILPEKDYLKHLKNAISQQTKRKSNKFGLVRILNLLDEFKPNFITYFFKNLAVNVKITAKN